MITITPEEKKFLVDYCMESEENTWLALAIGQIQPALRMAIVRKSMSKSSFLKELDRKVREKLEEGGLHCWKTRYPETYLKLPMRGDLYLMTMEAPKIEICLDYEGEDLFVGTPEKYKTCPEADHLTSFFEGTNPNLKSDAYWRWWFWLEGDHRRLEGLSTLHEDQELKREKIAYLTDILVRSAKAISEALEA